MRIAWIGSFVVALALAASGAARAQEKSLEDELRAVQDGWAVANYETPEKQQDAAFEALARRADAFAAAHPGRAEPLVWAGIVKSTWAGVRGGLGALRLVGESRVALEAAEQIDPRALDGSVYTSLGALYANVPGWPISFGDGAKARTYFLRALELNPAGIDPNYFYGAFLADEGETALARQHLERALAAPPRPGREVADAGRRKEIQKRLEDLPAR
jgi:tetratricopeptide (TPR) repeat protein